jgi:hypothetical protein
MKYFSSAYSSLLSILHALLFLLPNRLLRLLGHLFLFNQEMPKNGKWWFWFPVLMFKVIDVTLLPEIMSLLFSFVKFNSRKLTPTEIAEAKKVFGNNLNYNQIQVDENSLFAWMGSKFNKINHLGVVVFNSINFNCKLNCNCYNHDMGWMIHELTHILQFNKVGSAYIFYALYAQHTSGYYVGDVTNKKLEDFNFEQQAEIARFYYEGLNKKEENIYTFTKDNITNFKI